MANRSVCIIPARGGSKRLPRKNLLPLNGKPLVAHTIDAAVQSGCFDDVFVSSDDAEILKVAEEHGAKADKRPTPLAGDKVKAVEVIDEFIHRPEFKDKWDTVAMCLPTCPLKTVDDIRQAMELFSEQSDQCPRLVGVTKADRPQLALAAIDDSQMVSMREPDAYANTTRSQDMDVYYLPNGSIYIATTEEYSRSKTFFGQPMLVHIMPEERSLDIDEPYQFKLVEGMLNYLEGMS